MIGEVGTQAFGLKAEKGRKWYWQTGEGEDGGDGGGEGYSAAEASGKLYVGMLIMLIFLRSFGALVSISYRLFLCLHHKIEGDFSNEMSSFFCFSCTYSGLIVALILSQHNYNCVEA
jgi:hypothetical protein